jgi:hypothetical protein
MEPVLLLMTGYWVFRGLAALTAADDKQALEESRQREAYLRGKLEAAARASLPETNGHSLVQAGTAGKRSEPPTASTRDGPLLRHFDDFASPVQPTKDGQPMTPAASLHAALARPGGTVPKRQSITSRLLAPSPPASPALKAGRSSRLPTAARYTDAKSLFGAEYVSFTRLSTFEKCPHKFKLTYLEGYRQEDRDQSRQASEGDQFHVACENLYRKYLGQAMGKVMEDPIARADRRIAKVLDAVPVDSIVLASELELRFRARGREFLGYVDLAVELPDSTVGLIDYKTGYRDPRFPPDSIQLDIYSVPELLLRPNRSVRLAFVLVDANEVVAWTNGPDNRDAVLDRVRQRIAAVERESEFAPRTSGLCRSCHVREVCEAGGGESVFKQFARRQQK